MGIKAARRILHGKAQRTISLRRTGGQIAELTRLFITGETPVTMDDVTSGFNIGTNISIDSRFNELIGFTEQPHDLNLDNFA